MKLAYLILAHNSPGHFSRLVKTLRHKNVTIFAHVDSKSDIQEFSTSETCEHVIFIPERVAVYWGGYSLTQATLNLLRFAFSYGKFDYYQLLSGVDYPLKSNDVIISTLANSKCQFMEYDSKPLSRLERITLEGGFKSSNHLKSSLIMFLNGCFLVFSYFYKRDYRKHIGKLNIHSGANWWTLTGECVDCVLNFLKDNPAYTRAFKHSLCPDEMFFHTIVLNSKYGTDIQSSLTYTDWRKGGSSPREIGKEHLMYFEENPQFLFARKFSDGRHNLLDKIDQRLIT
ncbi:MAG: beta-1,6-N-acetylglucosaminyltransferase [bacterium]|nr:beta-1,6-N-acetylglucosaminyltransferase [bacterium]